MTKKNISFRYLKTTKQNKYICTAFQEIFPSCAMLLIYENDISSYNYFYTLIYCTKSKLDLI